MFIPLRLDERFLDRPGCGDELWCDSRLKTDSWLADSLRGVNGGFDSALDFDFVDGDGDELASH